MKRTCLFLPMAIVTALFAACGEPARDAPTTETNEPAAEPPAEVPSAEALLALEVQATRAYLGGDAPFFEAMLTDKFIMPGPGGSRLDKAAAVGMIAGIQCDVEEGWKLDEPRLSKIDADTFVLTYRATVDGTCAMGGQSRKIPSPVRAASVWVRKEDRWMAAFHGENPIFDPAAVTEPAAVSDAVKERDLQADKTPPGTVPAAPAADPSTKAMMAIEQAVWEAWKARDLERMEELTASDLAFVDIFGNVTSTKTETLKFWTEHACDVHSVQVVDGVGTSLSPAVGILSFTGMLEGSCGGQKFPVIYGTSVYRKSGDAWKLAFTLNHLTD